MDRSTCGVPAQLRGAVRSALGTTTALVAVSAIGIANVGVLAASTAWPFVGAPKVTAAVTVASPKAIVINVNRRLKGDRLALPVVSEEPSQKWNGEDEPSVPLPLLPFTPHDEDIMLIGCEPLVSMHSQPSADLIRQCITAVETYRKVAAIVHQSNASAANRRAIPRHLEYA